MKVINYKYGYNNTFNCSIHGKIVVTFDEWRKAREYLTHPQVLKKASGTSYYWKSTANMLREDLQRTIETKKSVLLNIRVPLTELLAKRYGLKIKRANYAIELIK